jgi:histidinol dehydrogenase
LGNWTTKATGDYATGANHVLPTGGMAKMYPPLGVDAYGKWMQVQECTFAGLKAIKETIETIAMVEELPAHKNSVRIRFTQ